MEFATLMAGLGKAGAFASGLGKLAGGLGLGGSKGPSLGKQMEYGWANAYHMPTYQVAGLKKAGIHPVYGLGGSANFSPTVATGAGPDPGQVGSGLAEMGQAVKPKVKTAMESLGLRQAEAETRKSEIGVQLAELELAREAQALNSQQDIAKTPVKTYPYRPGIVSGKPMPMWIEVVDRNGKIHHFPNPELGAELPESVGAGLLFQGQRNRGSAPRGGPRPASGRPTHYLRR